MKYGAITVFACLSAACSKSPCDERNLDELITETVLTAEDQARLTSEQIIQSLKDGNVRFCGGRLTLRNHSKQVRDAANGQHPKAVVLSCLDSRIPVEDVFDKGIGDMFVARVAGNVVNEDILGSLEFGCAVAGAKVIVVMGHENCGAIKAGIDRIETGNIAFLVRKIGRAVDQVNSFAGEKASSNKAYVHAVTVANIQTSLSDIRKNSPTLAKLESEGKLKIVGALYDLDTGEVMFLN
ncbi:carbonic anhydrase [Chryseolinea sp. Jin1]|uniref:Carbonic anhydrase n=2 Tax=Chryseolinea lacunae TaxID=2801331 RepID=A0ABS1KJS4_9BACT|nr:carbonic anhydrase [Chryseolinea lacunae]